MWFSLFERGPPTAFHGTFLATLGTTTASTHPLGIVGGAVKLRSGLEWFVLPSHGSGPRLREQSGYSGLIRRPECGFHCLTEPPQLHSRHVPGHSRNDHGVNPSTGD